jgi:hypothetical protein
MKYHVGQKLRVKESLIFNPCVKNGDIGIVTSVHRDGEGVSIKFPNVGTQICSRAEAYLEPATLSTGDMLNELAKNKKAKYVDRAGRKCISDTGKIKVTYNNEASILDIDEQWTFIEEPKEISLEEAIAYSKKGRTIICKYPNYNDPSQLCSEECRPEKTLISFHMLSTGKWYTNED